MAIAEHRAMAERGAELVELRVDWIARQPDLNRLLKDRPTPVVLTCRRPEDGGRWNGTEDQRMTLLRQAIVDGVEFVDLEHDIAGKVPRYGKTKRIVSFHDFSGTPDDLEERHEAMCKLDPDIVKVVTTATSPRDNVRLLKLVAEAKVPTIGFCMGEYGILSRVLCGRYGAPFTYATFSKDRVLAPGQLSFDEMRKLYNYDAINAETHIFGVVGDPIGHSLSPLLHNLAFRQSKLNAVYLPMQIPPEEFESTLRDYQQLGARGFSVTIPHKESALKFADSSDEATRRIGAANTLTLRTDGTWFASNTDYAAALEAVKLGVKASGGDQLSGLRVLILGAGGAARAIGQAMIHEGAALTITNRTRARGAALADELKCQFVTWENRGSAYADVLINCTPIGMSPNVDDTPFEQHWLRDGMVVFDTIYNPENTLLLKQAREHLCHTVSGVEMFVRQAADQFRLFTGREVPLDWFRQVLRKGISPVRVNAPTAEEDSSSSAKPQTS